MKSAAVDRRAHWLSALTAVGTYTIAITARMSQSNVLFQKVLKSVGVLVQIMQLDYPVSELESFRDASNTPVELDE